MATIRPALNGATVIASRPSETWNGAIAILVMAPRFNNESEYVTAITDSLESPEWHAGHYFWGIGRLSDAVADFFTR